MKKLLSILAIMALITLTLQTTWAGEISAPKTLDDQGKIKAPELPPGIQPDPSGPRIPEKPEVPDEKDEMKLPKLPPGIQPDPGKARNSDFEIS